MNKLIVLLLLCITSSVALAQQIGIKGSVIDTAGKTGLPNAVISVIRAKDSVLLKYTRTGAHGTFEIHGLQTGKVLLMVSYPNYADYIDTVSLPEGLSQTISIGQVNLITKAHLLEEVIVRQKISAIRIKGDTTEYKADSFYAGPNANVQELLKRMPGIQVNAKGEITAQGEKVQKVLVDGEEFFSDDPAVVTQTLRADVVDKVQVFDKKSDQAVFSGIDDGQKTKTINLQLKEDKKKGYFGKLEAGSDFNQYHYSKALLNSFKKKRKFAAYLTNDNTRYESLDWNERTNYSNDLNRTTTVQDDGSIWINFTSDDFSNGQGLPNSTTGGVLYSDKWNNDKQNINNTYQFNKLNVIGKTTTITQNILPDTTFINKEYQTSNNERQRNRMNSMYEWQIDSASSLKVTVTGSAINRKGTSNYSGQSISQENQIINQSDRTTTTDATENNLLSNIFWRKRFKKKGRTISFMSDINFTGRKNNGSLLAANKFFDKTGAQTNSQNIDQYKNNKETLSGISGRVVYTEPLWKKTFLELNYRFGFTGNNAERDTYNKNAATGKYENLVDSLTNHFQYNTSSQSGGFNFRFNDKKYSFSFGSGFGVSTFHLDDLLQGTSRNINFTNYLPTAGITFNPRKQRRISLTYTGSTRNPNLQQIQPFIDNTDPLNITIGNPNLKQEFRHTFNINASEYKILKSRNIYMGGNFSIVDNAISNASFVDSLGQRINQAINVNGNYNGNLWSAYRFEVAPSWNLGFSFNPNISRYINYVNGLKNISDNNSYGVGINFGRWSDKKINFYVNFEARHNNSTSSIRPDVVTRYWSYNSYSGLTVKLPKKFYFETEGNLTMYQKTNVFAGNRDVYLVNSSIKKTFSKKENWEVKFSVHDLFNQNRGINRNISSNFISETTQQTIQRFFLLSITYNFSKDGKPASF